jgi:hypothetical protein
MHPPPDSVTLLLLFVNGVSSVCLPLVEFITNSAYVSIDGHGWLLNTTRALLTTRPAFVGDQSTTAIVAATALLLKRLMYMASGSSANRKPFKVASI